MATPKSEPQNASAEEASSTPSARSRRSFLRQAAGLGLISTSVAGLVSACDRSAPDASGDRAPDTPSANASSAESESAARDGRGGGYGSLVSTDGPADLPRGFQARTFGAIGSEMSDGNLTPIALDGMAAFAASGSSVRLVRNHENRNGPTEPLTTENAYDPAGGGGVVTLEVGPDRTLESDFVSLSGTIVNCAGGPTPWGSWLSCEENTSGPQSGYEKPHGYVFEVPSSHDGPVEPVPIKPMGRFRHEAVAVDPATGIVYLTEDGASGFYRYLPNDTSGQVGSLHKGGTLQMLKVEGQPQIELFDGQSIGQTYDITWVDIDEPNPDEAEQNSIAVFLQGWEKGGARFDRLEGCWQGDGNIFFHDTSGGDAEVGQVWQYVPAQKKLVLVFESPGKDVLDSPDNLTVSPSDGIVMCEDGGGTDYIRGLTPGGEVFNIAKNTLNGREWAGATFSPDGRTLFANIQGPTGGTPQGGAGDGMTLAIWGPWRRGAL
jgi:secreted PhoX family phosphatase